jgi:hypothetical protein
MWLTNLRTVATGQWREAEELVIFWLKAQTIESADFVLDLEGSSGTDGPTICQGVDWKNPPKRFLFGPLELHTRSQELYKHKTKLKLHPQPFQNPL